MTIGDCICSEPANSVNQTTLTEVAVGSCRNGSLSSWGGDVIDDCPVEDTLIRLRHTKNTATISRV